MGSVCAEGAPPADPAGSGSDPDQRAGLDPARRLRLLLGVGAVVLAVDQLTKWWAVEALGDGRTIDLVWTARFNLVRNDGAAFSLGSDYTPFIALVAVAVSIAVIVVGRKIEQPWMLGALGLVLGGALGNVVDRLVRSGDGFLQGAVVDFIDLQWWPVFNVADMGIVIGGVLLALLVSERSHEDPVRHRPS